MRGNVMDMGGGIMIGAAFQKIVSSFVDDVLMPLISPFTSGVALSELVWVISPEVMEGETVVKAAAVLKYGAFIQSIVDFLIIAICIFIIVKSINSFRDRMEKKNANKQAAEEESAEVPAPTAEQELLTEIRDLLRDKQE
jgi:large conductance mechanosensitive channel